jgi:RNA polymerase sigma-70 factor (ECF subfamily)
MPDDEEVQLDRALLHRSAEGDWQAFLEFAGRHQAAVLRFCRALGARAEDAEDLMQETFLIAWRKAATFEGRGSARSWLFTVARRKLYRMARSPDFAAGRDNATLEELGSAAGWGGPGIRSDLNLEEQIQVRQAFERLSPSDRQVLVLRDLEGFTNAESAAILGVGISAVKSRLHRARLRMMGFFSRGTGHEG